MTHDPLCPNQHVDRSKFCGCDLIARVREDEATRAHRMSESYRSALHQAVEAVKGVQHSDDCYILYEENQRCVCGIGPCIAAIEALGGER